MIHEQQGIINTLVFAKQEKGHFSMNFVPYPRCNLIEKCEGTWHTLFGGPSLSQEQINKIKNFYERSLNNLFTSLFNGHVSTSQAAVVTTDQKKANEKKSVQKTDPFCRQEVIDKQKILDYPNYGRESRGYTVLYDSIPKGNSKDDPHFLVVPNKEIGHVDGSRVSPDQRKEMLEITQKVMKVIDNFKTILYLERNGSQLRGVQHQHLNIIGIQSFPHTTFQKVAAVIRQLCLLWFPFFGKLPSHELRQRADLCADLLKNI